MPAKVTKRQIKSLEKRIAWQINKIDLAIKKAVDNLTTEMGKLRELHQALTLKRALADRQKPPG